MAARKQLDVINRQEVLDRYYSDWEYNCVTLGKDDRDWLKQCLEESTTLEVTEVKHGHWIYHPFYSDPDIWLFHCSECGAPSARERNYCYDCGTLLDGDTVHVEQAWEVKKVRTINKNNPKNIYCDHCEHYDKTSGKYECYLCSCENSKHYLKHREYYHRCKQFEWKKDANYA